jgi:hypothetical protein
VSEEFEAPETSVIYQSPRRHIHIKRFSNAGILWLLQLIDQLLSALGSKCSASRKLSLLAKQDYDNSRR